MPETRVPARASRRAATAAARSAPGHDDLRQHRVIVGCHVGAALDPAVDTRLRRPFNLGEQAGTRLEPGVRLLGIEPRLDRRAARHQRALGERGADRVLAGGLADHPFDEVEVEHGFRHRMLDLQPRVHLEERKILARRVVDELDRAGRFVGDALAQADGGGVQPRADRIRQVRRWRFLQNLLVAPLQRAVALAERHHLATAIAEHLHLDVARGRDETLEIDTRITEARLRRALHGGVSFAQSRGVGAEHHADTAAAGGRLQHDGIADALRRGERGLDVGKQVGTGEQRHVALRSQRPRRMFQPEVAQVRRPWPDEDDSLGGELLGEAGVLRQEAVAGMHGFRTRRLAGGNDGVGVEVALRRRRRAEAHGLVGVEHRPREAVGIRIDGDRGDAHAAARADHTRGDLAAVRDEELFEHAIR